MIEKARGACPSCGKRISFRQHVLGPERFAIKCRGCGARLSKRTRAMSLSIAGVLALSATTRAYGIISWEYAAALVAILAVLAVVAHLTVRVTLAGDDVPDLPSTKFPKFETRSSPPPLDPTFRGSSGPPPERKD